VGRALASSEVSGPWRRAILKAQGGGIYSLQWPATGLAASGGGVNW